jgi:hypothetical protein
MPIERINFADELFDKQHDKINELSKLILTMPTTLTMTTTTLVTEMKKPMMISFADEVLAQQQDKINELSRIILIQGCTAREVTAQHLISLVLP